MGVGFLRVELYAGERTIPVISNAIQIKKNGKVLYNLATDKYGVTETIELTAPDIIMPDATLQPPPRETYDVEIDSFEQYKKMIITDVSIYDGITSILPLQMLPAVVNAPDLNVLNLPIYPCEPGGRTGQNVQNTDRIIPGYENRYEEPTPYDYSPNDLTEESAEGFNFGNTQLVLANDIALPEYVTVHMGRPNEIARDIRVPFREYLRNVASSEVYPTWADSALRANILCQISFVLNRIYTTWYRSRRHNFDITNSTTVDQCFRYNRECYDNINKIVDEIFNCFLRRTGRREPFFAEYCDGRVSQCAGLKQFGSQDLALKGYTPIQIIHYYYPSDMRINYTNQFFSNIGVYPGQFPGYTLRQGMEGAPIRTMQMFLNSISGRWYIPPISNPNGFFGPDTTRTVTEFQKIKDFNLFADGIIGRNTWYEITRVFVAERRLALLVSEGHRMSIGASPPTATIQMGSQGENVVELQFILAFIAEFFPTIPLTIQSGIFKENTRQAVLAFQRQYNLTADGIVRADTWRRLYDVYLSIADDIPYTPDPNIPAFPGTSLRQGDTGPDVLLMQNYLNDIGLFYTSIQRLTPDGNFGPMTANAVREFQRLFGLTQDAIIGPNTWYAIVDTRNNLLAGGTPPPPPPPPPPQPPYPGTALRQGDSGENVRLIQNRLIQMRSVFPSIPTLTADGSFGPNTRNAVIAFQRIFGLSPDGVVGPLSWNLIMNVSANLPNVSNPVFPGTLRVGMNNNNNVRMVQQYLNTISRNISITSTPLTVDGNFGTRTQQAVASFQRQYGLTGDGVVGPLTWNMLLSVYNAMNMKTAGTVSFIQQYMKHFDEMLPQSAFQEGETQGFSSTSGYDVMGSENESIMVSKLGEGYENRNDYSLEHTTHMSQLFALMFLFNKRNKSNY